MHLPLFLIRLFKMFFFVLLQGLVFSYIALWGVATPYIFIYFILTLPTDVGRNRLLLWGFFSGLLLDMISNTPGIYTSATLLLSFIRPGLLKLCTTFEEVDTYIPSSKNMGLSNFTQYLIFSVVIFVVALLAVGQMGQFSLGIYLRDVFASGLLTFGLLYIFHWAFDI